MKCINIVYLEKRFMVHHKHIIDHYPSNKKVCLYYRLPYKMFSNWIIDVVEMMMTQLFFFY